MTEHVYKLFDEKPCCIKYVFVEPDYASLLIIRQPDTLRAISFFNVTNAYRAVRFVEFPDKAPLEYTWLQCLSNIFKSVWRHYSNIGLVHSEPDPYTEAHALGRGYPIDNSHVGQTYSPTEDALHAYNAGLWNMSRAPVIPELLSIVAGPIVRATDLLPQMRTARIIASVDFKFFLALFVIGYFKKAVVSDNVSPIVDMFFASPAQFGAADAAEAIFLYATQIYCDFSGYTDMAIAVAGMLGYQLKPNFNHPYLAPILVISGGAVA